MLQQHKENKKLFQRESVIIKKIQDTVFKNNRNYVGLMSGRVGTGKSYCAAAILKQVDPTFHIHRIFFSVEELAAFLKTDPPKGTAFMLDEAGVATNYRRWHSRENEQMMDFLQTWRAKGWVCIFVSPSQKLIDKVTHGFFDQMMETIEVYQNFGYAKIKVKETETSSATGKVYKKYTKTKIDEGPFRSYKISSVYVQYAGKEFRIPYEKMKKTFMNKIIDDGHFKLEGGDNKIEQDRTLKRTTLLQEEIYKQIWQGDDRKTIAQNLKIPYNKVCGAIIGLRKKGFELPPRGYVGGKLAPLQFNRDENNK